MGQSLVEPRISCILAIVPGIGTVISANAFKLISKQTKRESQILTLPSTIASFMVYLYQYGLLIRQRGRHRPLLINPDHWGPIRIREVGLFLGDFPNLGRIEAARKLSF
jgi:hypothetical protein